MAFQESYWVVVGTAAPVIALANVVALTDSREARYFFMEAREKAVEGTQLYRSADRSRRTASALFGFGWANVTLQGLVLLGALWSLESQANQMWPWFAWSAEFAGLILLGWVAIFSGVVKALVRRVGTLLPTTGEVNPGDLEAAEASNMGADVQEPLMAQSGPAVPTTRPRAGGEAPPLVQPDPEGTSSVSVEPDGG